MMDTSGKGSNSLLLILLIDLPVFATGTAQRVLTEGQFQCSLRGR